ncbi:hypothetical protein O3M35_006483 [Rhynocoris fuscipes]|uniref:Uncharacterized protein n=1 Tax=Rhynocoris fuscipes TaxID=488301 RepID=A0AAW1DF37_9HEMI
MITFLVLLLICDIVILAQDNSKKNNENLICGKRQKQESKLELGSYTVEPGDFPWHVGIYKYDKVLESYDNICGGSIISSHIVLTAASCVYDTAKRSPHKATLFKVVAGKISYHWNTPDNNAQEINVKDIAVPKTYLGDAGSYSENVAAINLAKDIYFSDLVLPVCISWRRESYQDTPYKIVQTAGWGLKGEIRHNPNLKEAYLKYIDNIECRDRYTSIRYRRFINFDKICVLTPNGRRDYDTGGGLVKKKDGGYYLMAILSANVNNEFSPATNISHYLNWIKSTVDNFKSQKRCKDSFTCMDGSCLEEGLVCDGTKHCQDGTDEADGICLPNNGKLTSATKGSCMLPNQRGGVSYTKVNCKNDCDMKAGISVRSNEIIKINCGRGFGLNETIKEAKVVCSAGTWFPSDPECIRLCPGLRKDHLNLKCSYKHETVNCNSFMKPGSLVEYGCEKHYTINDPYAFSGNTICLPGGTWKESLPTCRPECGIINVVNNAETTISGGKVTQYGKYPWHTAIFKIEPYNSSFVNICGGTLIHASFILTAAHCMFDLSSNQKFEESDLKVAVGKFKRDYYQHESHQQTANVKKIIVPDTYTGFKTRYGEDIALLLVDKPFVFNDFVLPACIDRSKSFQVRQDMTGTIVGWGFTESENFSEDLKEVHLSVRPIVECRKSFKDFVEFITSDKFCVIYRNGSGTQSGDSGGGMTFDFNGRHYVQGIVSIKKRNENIFSVFTNVTSYLTWIYSSMQSNLQLS